MRGSCTHVSRLGPCGVVRATGLRSRGSATLKKEDLLASLRQAIGSDETTRASADDNIVKRRSLQNR